MVSRAGWWSLPGVWLTSSSKCLHSCTDCISVNFSPPHQKQQKGKPGKETSLQAIWWLHDDIVSADPVSLSIILQDLLPTGFIAIRPCPIKVHFPLHFGQWPKRLGRNSTKQVLPMNTPSSQQSNTNPRLEVQVTDGLLTLPHLGRSRRKSRRMGPRNTSFTRGTDWVCQKVLYLLICESSSIGSSRLELWAKV